VDALYFGDALDDADGMTAFVTAEFGRVKGALPPAQTAALAGFQVSTGDCVAVAPVLLTTVATTPGGGSICLNSLLVAHTFASIWPNSGLGSFYDQLVAAGLDPSQFNGTYDPRLQRMTQLDFDAGLATLGASTQAGFAVLLDFELARAAIRVLSNQSPSQTTVQQWNTQAIALVRSLNGLASNVACREARPTHSPNTSIESPRANRPPSITFAWTPSSV